MKTKKQKITISGKPTSPGLAIGKAFVYKDILSRELSYYSIRSEEVQYELERIKNSIKHAIGEIHSMKKTVESEVGKPESDIFQAHKEILKDKKLIEDLEKELKNELINAEQAVKNVFRRWASKFALSESKAFKSKIDDLKDISKRLLRILLGYEKSPLERLPYNSIIVAKRLLPSDTVHLKSQNLRGIVVEEGSENSHSAIIARALGIPAISNIGKNIEKIKNGVELLLDAKNGSVLINPSLQDKKNYDKRIALFDKQKSTLIKKAKEPAKTKNGKNIKVNANASSREDFKNAVLNGADGIGLFRVEQVYMSSKILPDEDFLLDHFKKVLEPVKDKEITFRLLDIGGDKKLPYLEIEDELNPSLGLRGIRLLLRYKNLLKTQLRVILLLSKEFDVRILVPMVTIHEEIKEARTILDECKKELFKKGNKKFKNIPIGAMIETPAAVMNVEKLIKYSDFLSLGTNDLIQYTMAAGRENANVSNYYNKGVDIVQNYIKDVTDIATKKGIPCSICGEMAGDLNLAKTFIGFGIKEFSVSPYIVPGLKEKIRNITL